MIINFTRINIYKHFEIKSVGYNANSINVKIWNSSSIIRDMPLSDLNMRTTMQ